MADRTCIECGDSFTQPNRRGRPPLYCSDACRGAVRVRAGLSPVRRPAPRRVAPATDRTCDVCFSRFISSGGTKRCSPECSTTAKAHARQKWPVNACLLNVRSCVACSAPFILRRETTGASRRKCNACTVPEVDRLRARRAARRNAVAAGEIIRLADVAHRDGDRCQLCRRKVDMRRAHPDPMSPSLDHIIPLSEGGKHAMSNVQLAHLRCNMSKGARPAGEQLRLVG